MTSAEQYVLYVSAICTTSLIREDGDMEDTSKVDSACLDRRSVINYSSQCSSIKADTRQSIKLRNATATVEEAR